MFYLLLFSFINSFFSKKILKKTTANDQVDTRNAYDEAYSDSEAHNKSTYFMYIFRTV